jgi:hypothetical protein
MALPRHCCVAHGSIAKRGEVKMQKQWTLEMHYPGDGKDSLITTDT